MSLQRHEPARRQHVPPSGAEQPPTGSPEAPKPQLQSPLPPSRHWVVAQSQAPFDGQPCDAQQIAGSPIEFSEHSLPSGPKSGECPHRHKRSSVSVLVQYTVGQSPEPVVGFPSSSSGPSESPSVGAVSPSLVPASPLGSSSSSSSSSSSGEVMLAPEAEAEAESVALMLSGCTQMLCSVHKNGDSQYSPSTQAPSSVPGSRASPSSPHAATANKIRAKEVSSSRTWQRGAHTSLSRKRLETRLSSGSILQQPRRLEAERKRAVARLCVHSPVPVQGMDQPCRYRCSTRFGGYGCSCARRHRPRLATSSLDRSAEPSGC